MRYALINEAMPNVTVHRPRTRRGSAHLRFLELPVARIGKQIERVSRAHDAGTRQRQRDTRGIDRDPAAPPLLGDKSGRARTTSWVKHQVTGICGHEDAARYHLNVRFDDISLI